VPAYRAFLTLLTLLIASAPIAAENVQGHIVVKRKLTKKRVTPTASVYQRGVGVALGPDAPTDVLSFERARVVVYLDGEHASNPITATMEQKQRRFVPDTLVIPAGSTVSFPNLDPVFHNVFSLSKIKSFDLGNYPKDHTRTVMFPKPGIVFVDCHLHPNMAGVIVVSPNGWNARPDGAGLFSIPDIPPGEYTVVAWHKTAGFFRQKVEVLPDRGASVDFLIPLGAEDPPAK
jgi:plastocyanin